MYLIPHKPRPNRDSRYPLCVYYGQQIYNIDTTILKYDSVNLLNLHKNFFKFSNLPFK